MAKLHTINSVQFMENERLKAFFVGNNKPCLGDIITQCEEIQETDEQIVIYQELSIIFINKAHLSSYKFNYAEVESFLPPPPPPNTNSIVKKG